MNYKIVLVIILLIIMFCLDVNLDIENFKNPFKIESKGNISINPYKKTLWVYYPKKDKCGLCDLCISTIYKNLEYIFKIHVFDNHDVNKLLPEFKYNTNLKLEILNKYGGLWMPNTSIILRPFSINEKSYMNDELIIFDTPTRNYTRHKGFLYNNIIASKAKTPTLKKLLKNINNPRVDILLHPITLNNMLDGREISPKELIGGYQNNIILKSNHKIFYIDRTYMQRFPHYKILFEMSKYNIMHSNYFIRALFEYGQYEREDLLFNEL